MTRKIAFVIMIALFSNFVQAQSNLNHFYVKIDGSDSTKFKMEFGQIHYDKKYKPKRVQDESISSLEELGSQLRTVLAQEETSDVLNIFIHGIWADTRGVWEQMVQKISRDSYDHEDNVQKVMLSIIWDSSFDYRKGVKIARKKGNFISSFFVDLLTADSRDFKVNFLCHSMGNRVFQHIITESKLIERQERIINQFVSVAADIESNIFEEGEPLYDLENIVNDITIYIHQNDRTLGMSRLINSKDRLGLNGVSNFAELADNFRVIDVSVITDNEGLSPQISNHRYFYTSPSIREDLKRVLWYRDFETSKKELDSPRRLKLLPRESSK